MTIHLRTGHVPLTPLLFIVVPWFARSEPQGAPAAPSLPAEVPSSAVLRSARSAAFMSVLFGSVFVNP
jgi:hypothetical protein